MECIVVLDLCIKERVTATLSSDGSILILC